MNEWLIFTSTNKEKIRLHVSVIVGITPCGNVMYGSNILLKNSLVAAVMEKPDRVWEMYEIALKNFSEKENNFADKVCDIYREEGRGKEKKGKEEKELTNWILEQILRLQIRMAPYVGMTLFGDLLRDLEEMKRGEKGEKNAQ